jgi:putative endonuclease
MGSGDSFFAQGICDIRYCAAPPPMPKILSFRRALKAGGGTCCARGAAMAEKLYYIYILASKSRVIYVGMTGFLMARVLRHRTGEGGAFTAKYRVHRLVYFHGFRNVEDAIAREAEIKKWRREKKVALIHAENPTWEDLAAGWGEAAEMSVSGKTGSSPGFQPGSE